MKLLTGIVEIILVILVIVLNENHNISCFVISSSPATLGIGHNDLLSTLNHNGNIQIKGKRAIICNMSSNNDQEQSNSNDDNDGEYRWVCNGVVTDRDMPLNEAIIQIVGGNDKLSIERANELIELGAVWIYDPNYDEDEEEYFDNRRVKNNDQRFKRQMEPMLVPEGVQIRCYPNAKRFTDACKQITIESKLYEDTTFIIVDKPPMLPTQPDASNYLECLPGCVNDNIGPFVNLEGELIDRPLICHRVDSCVGGCVVLSKDRNGQRVFSALQKERKVKKVYKAITSKPVPIGMHMHWMWAAGLARGENAGPSCQLLSHNPEGKKKNKEWMRCVLEVTNCEPIDIPSDILTEEERNFAYYENTIRLVTGRKHQVRAQLASLGCPILRDSLYSPISGMTLDLLSLGPQVEEALDKAISSSRVPQQPIGLQAHAILFGGVRAIARTPWWSRE